MESASSLIEESRPVNAAPPKDVARYLACSWRSANYAAAWAPAARAQRVCCCSYVGRAQGVFAGDFRYDDGYGVGSYETCAAGVGAARAQGEEQALQRSLCVYHCPSGRVRTGRYSRPQFLAHADGSMHGLRAPPSSRDDHAGVPFRFRREFLATCRASHG